MHVLFQLSVTALAASMISANHVLVLGKSPTVLWHDTRSSAAFLSSGLADLALNSLGLPTGRFSLHSVVQSPLQADIFTHSDAYALVILEEASTSSLEAVNAALSDDNAFHELYPAQACKLNVPMAVAQEFHAKYPSAAHCAGNADFCSSLEAFTPLESEKLVHQVLETNSFLSSSDDQDIVFAKQIAQVMQLTADMKQHGDEKMLYIVGISSLSWRQTAASTTSCDKNCDGVFGSIDEERTARPIPSASEVVSMRDIAEYQIILWTSVLLGAVLLGAVLAMANMDAGRDSLLYAKFIADVNGRKTN
ncbi:unnamed protein product [Peronospora destructor]|uniref:Uncharacterized protein n=1 Tax=Peronospora destructor TaxID=86335 RepID=A0AAV0VCP6_9STRA|nr:unnamed protein product [Peronospora destructor]